MAERLIGIDSGGTVTKAGLFDLDGNELATEGRSVPMDIPAPGLTERDPDRLWAETASAIRSLLERTGTAPRDIIAVTPSGFGAGAFFVDAEGRPTRPAIVSTDTRSERIVSRWYEDGRAQKAERTVHTRIFPGHTSAILAWLQKHESAALERTSHILWCKDFLRLRLTGEVSTDLTDATCPGMWDYERNTWATEALDALGIGAWADKLPPVGEAVELAGSVTGEAASESGLMKGTPVARGAYDIIACSLASGITRSDQLGVIGGTFSIASTLHREPCRDPLPNHQSVYPAGGLCLASTASATSGSNLEWVLETFLGAEKVRQVTEGRSLYAYINRLIAERAPKPSTMTFLPNLFNGRPAGLVGMNAGDRLGDVLHAVFEGIVCAHRTDIERLLEGSDAVRPESIRLAGGVSKSDEWAQMFADALGLPVEIADGNEFGTKGAAVCGAVAAGARSNVGDAIAQMVRIDRRFEPRPERKEDFNDAYARHLRLQQALASEL